MYKHGGKLLSAQERKSRKIRHWVASVCLVRILVFIQMSKRSVVYVEEKKSAWKVDLEIPTLRLRSLLSDIFLPRE